MDNRHGRITAPMLLASALLLPASALPTVARAQETPDAQGGGAIGDIMVTAQRREQSLQSVPIAVTALTADSLQESGITDMGALTNLTPGLVMTTSRASATPYLRGVGTQVGDPGGSASIATYVDGVYIAAPAAGLFSFNNIKRIEVIKGPQGTLFGRNATGGLIHIITDDPSQEAHGRASIGYGDYDTTTGSFYATAGVLPNLAADLSFWGAYQGEGFGKNVTLGGDVNFRRELAVRSKWLWTLSPDTDLTLALDYTENTNDTGHTRQVSEGAFGVGNTPYPGNPYDTQANLPPDVQASQRGASLHVRHDFGWAEFESTTAARRVQSWALFDQDTTPIPRIDAVFAEVTDSFQQEFTLNGGGDRLDWTVGVFYFDMSASTDPISIRSTVVGPLNIERDASQDATSYAVFAQGTYNVTDDTRLTLGARYSKDEISIVGVDRAAPGNPAPVGSVVVAANQSDAYEEPTYRLALDHDLTDDILVYASYGRGFKSGQYNVNSFSRPAVEPETIDAYEIGLKSDLFDNRVRLNAAAFFYDYRNIQLLQVAPGSPILVNAAGAEIQGLDLEATWLPQVAFGTLEMRAAATLLDGEYTDYPNATFYSPNPAGGLFQFTGDAAGNQTIRSPDWTLSLSGNYSFPTDMGEIDLNLSYYHSDQYYFDPDNVIPQEAYDIWNAQASLTLPNEDWSFRVFGRNLADEVYFSTMSRSTLGDLRAPAPPRTYGVEIAYRWGQ